MKSSFGKGKNVIRKRGYFSAAAVLLSLVLLTSGSAFAASFSYDFNNLTGNDAYPFADLNGQDGWTSQGFIYPTPCCFIMGVTATSGFDGTQALRFEDVGAGYGADASHKRTASFAIPVISGSTTMIVLQGDFHVGAWANVLEFAYDANNDGVIRQTDPTEIGPGLNIGTVPGVMILSAARTPTNVPLASLDINPSGGDWVRLRLEIDPTNNGSGSVYYQNLTRGHTGLQPVPGLQNIDMELDWGATGVTNPALWDSVYIHLEGAGNQFNNLYLSADGADLVISYLSGSAVAENGGNITKVRVLCRITNEGDAPAPASIADFYLSRDTTVSGDDVYLGSVNVRAVAEGGEVAIPYWTTFTLPPGVSSSGTWYIIGVADADDAVSELNETNNVRAELLSFPRSRR